MNTLLASIQRHSSELLRHVGITISIEQAYQEYANALEDSCVFLRAQEAYQWFVVEEGAVGFWRHRVYPILYSERYAERKRQYEEGKLMQQQAVMNAVLREGEKYGTNWQAEKECNV